MREGRRLIGLAVVVALEVFPRGLSRRHSRGFWGFLGGSQVLHRGADGPEDAAAEVNLVPGAAVFLFGLSLRSREA